MWLDIIKEVITEAKEIISHRKKKKEQVYTAIEAIQKAANRTSIHITKSLKGTYRGNLELSDLWLEAAKAVREVDNKMYLKLLENSYYWASPDLWTEEQLAKSKSYLLYIKREAKSILQDKI